MNRLFNLYRLLNTLSIDVALGAVAGAGFLAYTLDVKPAWQDLVCLGLTVWLIYTTDHLMDAKKIKKPAATHRHRFHQVHYNVLLGITVVIGGSIFLLLFMLKQATLAGGAVLALLVFLYFLGQPQLGFLKELVAAILYTGGVALPVLSLLEKTLSLFHVFIIMVLATTALANLVLFSWFDYERDQRDNHPSLTRRLGADGTKRFLYFLFLFQVALAAYGLALFLDRAHFMGILLLMNGGLLFIFIKWRWFAVGEKYRMAGDAIFLFPTLYLLF